MCHRPQIKTRRTTTRLLCAAILAALALSCQPDIAWHSYGSTHEDGWFREDTVKLGIGPLRKGGHFAEELEFRTSARYPFTTLRIVVDKTVVRADSTRREQSDTVTCRVADAEGRPLGEGLNFYQYRFPFQQERLSAGDSVSIRITHDMQSPALCGVLHVGYRLTRN